MLSFVAFNVLHPGEKSSRKLWAEPDATEEKSVLLEIHVHLPRMSLVVVF